MNSFSQSYFLHEKKKNVVVYKLSSCFNTSEFLLLGRVRVRGMGQGGCVGQTFQSENWCLAFKGLITHIPLASNRIISHVGAVCLQGRGGVVIWIVLLAVQMEKCHSPWVYGPSDSFLNCIRQSTAACNTFQLWSQRWKNKTWRWTFSHFPFFQKGIIFQNSFPVPPNTNSLVCLSSLDKKKVRMRAC